MRLYFIRTVVLLLGVLEAACSTCDNNTCTCNSDFDCRSPRVCDGCYCENPTDPGPGPGTRPDSGPGDCRTSGMTLVNCNCGTDPRAIPSTVSAPGCCSGQADHLACVDSFGNPLFCCAGCGFVWTNVCR